MARRRRTDLVGSRGEQIFYLAATDYRIGTDPLFLPRFLGEKCPDVDFLVNLVGARGIFFVQVKSTEAAVGRQSLTVRLTGETCQRLLDLPGPTYVVGVHEPSGRCFIRSIDATTNSGLTSIPLAHELHPDNLKRLFDEVRAFWTTGPYKPQRSHFS